MSIFHRSIWIVSFFCSLQLLSACLSFATNSYATRAEKLKEEGKLEEAVEAYRRHIQTRLQAKDKPESENPYFYELYIGDIYLELMKPDLARDAYSVALEADALPQVTKERFRRLADYHADQGDLETAISVLREFRYLDQFMFDLDLDRLHKEMIRIEDEKHLNDEK